MRQRVAIARTLILSPRIILMDEPFGALDPTTRLNMQELLVDLWREAQATVFFVTHSIEEALFLGDRIYVFSGAPGTILHQMIVPPRDDAGKGDAARYRVRGAAVRDPRHHGQPVHAGKSRSLIEKPACCRSCADTRAQRKRSTGLLTAATTPMRTCVNPRGADIRMRHRLAHSLRLSQHFAARQRWPQGTRDGALCVSQRCGFAASAA